MTQSIESGRVRDMASYLDIYRANFNLIQRCLRHSLLPFYIKFILATPPADYQLIAYLLTHSYHFSPPSCPLSLSLTVCQLAYLRNFFSYFNFGLHSLISPERKKKSPIKSQMVKTNVPPWWWRLLVNQLVRVGGGRYLALMTPEI